MAANPPAAIATQEREVRLDNRVLFKALWPFIRPYVWMLGLTTLLVFVVTFFELLMPILTQKAFDGFILPTGPESFASLAGIKISSFTNFCLIFAGITCTAFVIDFCQSLFMEYTGQKIILGLRCALFAHMTGLPVSYYDKNSSGRLVSRVAGDIENMNEMFTSVLVFIFKDLVLMTGILGVMFFINARMALTLFLVVPLIIASVLVFSKILRNAFRTIRQKIAEINHSFSEGIIGIKIIQTIPSKKPFMKRFARLNQEHFSAAMFQIRIFALFMPFIGFLGVASIAVILWTGSFAIMDQTLSLGELIAFLSYMKLFFRPLRDLSEKFNLLQNALSSAERIILVLQQPKARERVTRTRNPLKTIDRIEFESIDFSYTPKKPVLEQINFSLGKGKSIGIVGQTGSGKSSIINLLTGFYRPDAGRILINHIPHDSMDITDIRSRTALVMQDPFLFSGTIRENITPRGESHKDCRLETALKKADCTFLSEKFAGLDTLIREGGAPLSSGEKQLICIARAFAFDPDLIIFDEATSYMDSQSEQRVHKAMKKLMQGRLSIIIAHRLSTIRDCDQILLLREGKIREKGSHRELIDLNGEYHHLLKKEMI
ncbi:MAG: ABC transporter ATP-binding protein/permease [Proteobacteria bacterium]|nr:ABC transporter ATP-binding protein/permease [Pseudomonadota bacterium]